MVFRFTLVIFSALLAANPSWSYRSRTSSLSLFVYDLRFRADDWTDGISSFEWCKFGGVEGEREPCETVRDARLEGEGVAESRGNVDDEIWVEPGDEAYIWVFGAVEAYNGWPMTDDRLETESDREGNVDDELGDDGFEELREDGYDEPRDGGFDEPIVGVWIVESWLTDPDIAYTISSVYVDWDWDWDMI